MDEASAITVLLVALGAELVLLVLLVVWESLHRAIHAFVFARLPCERARHQNDWANVEIALAKLRTGDPVKVALACDDLGQLPPFDNSVERLSALARDPSAEPALRIRATEALVALLKRETRGNPLLRDFWPSH